MTSRRDLRERPPIDRDPLEYLAASRAALMRLLAEQVLDAHDVIDAQVAMVALEPFSGRVSQPTRDRPKTGGISRNS